VERIVCRIAVLSQVLQFFAQSIELFNEYQEIFINNPIKRNEQLFVGMRDSMIQRFEYCTDLFFRVVKVYLEDVEKITLSINSPRGILRKAVKARLLSEREGQQCMMMVESRNKTSHIYHELMAEDIARKVPDYYQLIRKIVDRLKVGD